MDNSAGLRRITPSAFLRRLVLQGFRNDLSKVSPSVAQAVWIFYVLVAGTKRPMTLFWWRINLLFCHHQRYYAQTRPLPISFQRLFSDKAAQYWHNKSRLTDDYNTTIHLRRGVMMIYYHYLLGIFFVLWPPLESGTFGVIAAWFASSWKTSELNWYVGK